MKDWSHKDIWRMRGKYFLVEVSRHVEEVPEHEGPHRWCVYAYMYPRHPMFHSFDQNAGAMAQSGLSCHSYPSYFRVHRDSESVTAIQIGWDYNHDGDDMYCHYATKDEAGSVFYDAERLVQSLTGETE